LAEISSLNLRTDQARLVAAERIRKDKVNKIIRAEVQLLKQESSAYKIKRKIA
jgi:hypothetical protein